MLVGCVCFASMHGRKVVCLRVLGPGRHVSVINLLSEGRQPLVSGALTLSSNRPVVFSKLQPLNFFHLFFIGIRDDRVRTCDLILLPLY